MARRPSLRPALKGCLALVQQRGESSARCASADAVEIARALLAVNVRSLTVVDRQLCLHLLLALAKVQLFTTFLSLLFTFYFLQCRIVFSDMKRPFQAGSSHGMAVRRVLVSGSKCGVVLLSM